MLILTMVERTFTCTTWHLEGLDCSVQFQTYFLFYDTILGLETSKYTDDFNLKASVH